ncbi:hypothetical protein [Allosphingosinicella sp.]|uniref:hypothetical protein n=1 Tax=Allosphingosinicella sp. TaxID=2823234 RepID=UPI003D740A4B
MKYAIALLMSILWLAPAAAQEERGSSLVCVAVDDQAQVYYHSRTFEADPAIPGETYNSSFLNHVRSQFGATLTGGCQFTSLPQNVPIYLDGLKQQCPDCAIYSLRQVGWAPGTPASPNSAKFSDGTYVLEDGSYSLRVKQEGDDLVVVEPNKNSRYERQADGTYHFTNPNNGISYWLRVIDDRTIEAFKKEPGNVASRLVRVGGSPGPASAPPNPAAAIAERYKALAQSDPDNVQAWTACAAAALKRSLATETEADVYGAEMVQVLKLIIVDPSRSPCEDAIPASLWEQADAAEPVQATESAAAGLGAARRGTEPAAPSLSESERQQMQVGEMLGRNEEGWQRVKAQAEAATKAQQAAQQEYEAKLKAFQDGIKAAEAARQQYERDRAAHEAEVARAKAARAQWEAEVGNN